MYKEKFKFRKLTSTHAIASIPGVKAKSAFASDFPALDAKLAFLFTDLVYVKLNKKHEKSVVLWISRVMKVDALIVAARLRE